MTIEAGLAASRFVHFAALAVLFGVELFAFYGFARTDAAAAFRARIRRASFWLALGGLVSGLAWAAFTAAAMQNDMAGALDPDTWRTMVLETSFGAIWVARLGIVAMLFAWIALSPSAKPAAPVALSLAAAALGSIALTGHTQMQEGWSQSVHVAADAAHLLAAGAWLGGIAALLALLFEHGESAAETAATALTRFSPVGMIVVAALIATGIANSLFMLPSPGALFESAYGRTLLLKIVLFAAMLALAAHNKFVLTPKLDSARVATLAAFKRQVLAEQLLGLCVLAVVAALGMSEPPG